MLENIKTKVCAVACSPKVVSAVNKATNTVSAVTAAVAALAASAVNASAIDWGATITAESALGEISSGASPFIEPAIVIMCGVAGLRLGMRFLRGSTH